MKKIILILSIFTLFSCSEETVYKVDAELQPYVESFYAEAGERGHTLQKDNLLVVMKASVQAHTNVGNGGGQKYIYFSEASFGYLSEDQIEFEMYAGLAPILLGKSLSGSIKEMPEYSDVEYAQAVYTQDSREEILNRLFK